MSEGARRSTSAPRTRANLVHTRVTQPYLERVRDALLEAEAEQAGEAETRPGVAMAEEVAAPEAADPLDERAPEPAPAPDEARGAFAPEEERYLRGAAIKHALEDTQYHMIEPRRPRATRGNGKRGH